MTASRQFRTSRSEILDGNRCRRLRWHGYSDGPEEIGIQPVRKSIHLVIGGAVHAGLEPLLRVGQDWVRTEMELQRVADHLPVVEQLFTGRKSDLLAIEDAAVKAALSELAESTKFGVETDVLEQQAMQQMQQQQQIGVAGGDAAAMTAAQSGCAIEAPIMIEFGDIMGGDSSTSSAAMSFDQQLVASVNQERATAGEEPIWGAPIFSDPAPSPATIDAELSQLASNIEVNLAANAQAATGIDDYMRQELAALVEGMVRAYARRRLRPLLERFEVLEVEREGEWKLAEAVTDRYEDNYPRETAEIIFQSRADALLREYATNSLYIESFKTTGQWDRRKQMEAEIDMQGLTEAVDIERRLGEAWRLLREVDEVRSSNEGNFCGTLALAATQKLYKKIDLLINEPTAIWLSTLPSPPRILGIRYEYLIKGQRKQEGKDANGNFAGRYVADSPLVRTYSQAGIVESDRKWAHSYSYYNLSGQSKRLDYRSWKKEPVWRHMSIRDWIDQLDSGSVQPEAYDEDGRPIDLLAAQFIEPIHVYRNDDDMRDMLEQMEAGEVRWAEDVMAVRRAKERGEGEYRSELNRRMPQNRSACVFPGLCSMMKICFGSPDMRRDPLASELYSIRVPNHPLESV